MPPRALNIAVFVGTARNASPDWGGLPRLATPVTRFVVTELQKRGHEVVVFDPLQLELPLLDKPHHFYKAGSAPEKLEDLRNKVKAADAYIVVSGEYNHLPPAPLLNTMSFFGGSNYAYKPSGIVCYSVGQFGGMRAAMALRPFLAELGCLAVSNICSYPKAQEEFSDVGEAKDESAGKRFSKMLEQLEWWAEACLLKKEAK